jgi:hypothetical protein
LVPISSCFAEDESAIASTPAGCGSRPSPLDLGTPSACAGRAPAPAAGGGTIEEVEMTRTIDIAEQAVEQPQDTLTYEELSGLNVQQAERKLESFVAELRKMTPEERIRASRYTMNRWEYWVYAARFPDEVPIVNGELERIALTLE